MKQVNVSKHDLIAVLKKNRREHRGLFLEAQKVYRELVIKTLDEQLEYARCNSTNFNMNKIIKIVAPADYTSEYDRAINMLEMSTDSKVSITQDEYRCYVEDEWGWMRDFSFSNSRYVSSPKFDKYK